MKGDNNLHEIIRKLIHWTEKTGMIPTISFAFIQGGIYCVLTLSKNGKSIEHMFYIAGGCLTLENWDRFYLENEYDVGKFILEAKEKLEVE